MNHRARRIVETAACARRYGIADEKGAEYSGKGSSYKESGADTLANFKRVGERRGISPESALMVYLDKHMDSISTAVKEANACRKNDEGMWMTPSPRDVYAAGEGIISRLDDARNYLDLLECLLMDLGHISDSVLLEEELPVPWMEAEIKDERTLPDDNGDFEEVPEGSIRGFDGVIRPRTMPEGTPVQTPIYAQPSISDPSGGVPSGPTMDAVRRMRQTLYPDELTDGGF